MMMRLTVSSAVTLALACSCAIAHAQEKPQTRDKMIGSPGGRFVLGQIGEYQTSQYLLDTATGRVWEVISITDNKGTRVSNGLRQVKFYTAEGSLWGSEPPPTQQQK